MAFLAKVSSLNRKRDSLGTIQCNVLEANTILDAIGNARTMRNDNSSRFGKYVKLHFDNEGELIGAGLDTFLLETTRVVRRNQDEERNFHIFYLLCSESDPKQREELKLQSPETYSYLNSSGIYDRRDGVKDSDMLDQLKASLKMLNIEPDDLQSLLKCFVAILTIGNVKFSSHTTTAGTVEIKVEEGTEQYLTAVAELLEISPDNLLQSFTTRNMVVVGDEVLVTLTDVQAEELRDVFAKTLYSVIFAWLIEFLNVQLSTDDHSFDSFALSSTKGTPKVRRRSSHSIVAGIDRFGSRIRTDSDASSAVDSSARSGGMIGILDIFGFEKQVHNGLEQLLINYANETLQKQYDEVMVDAEQSFYASENISWDFIQFPSNADCIELISSKGVSVLSLLDEACLAPSGSDASFIRQIYNVLSTHERLHLTSRIKGHSEFGINHYAGTVIYSVADFVHKNKNEIFPLALLKESTNSFVTRMGQSATAEEKNTTSSSSSSVSSYSNSPMKPNNKKFLTATISNSFKKSVTQLIQTIDETQAHYVKCIKPNSLNVKNNFVLELVSEQLRCNGIMQTIVVTRCGYPIRFTYEHFNDRYFSLMRALFTGKDFTVSAGVDAVIARLRQALAAGEINIRESVTTLDSVGGLQKAITRSGSLESLNSDDLKGWGIQRGKTRVFLRYNEYAALDTMHDIMVGVMATNIQRVFRGYVCAKGFKKIKDAAIRICQTIRRFHNNLHLIAAVLVMQDFFRHIVRRRVMKKRIARQVISTFISRRLGGMIERVKQRRIAAVRIIFRWWTRSPWFISSERRLFLKDTFSNSIGLLQCGVRIKLSQWRRRNVISNYRSSATKPAAKSSFVTPTKEILDEAWVNGSTPIRRLSSSFDSSSLSQHVTCRDLLRANNQILWLIFSFYAHVKANIPGNSVSVSKRNATKLVTGAGMINLLKDWSLVPSLCSQYKATNLLKQQLVNDKSTKKMFSFTGFINFIINLASTYYNENDTRELTDKIKLLDDQYQWAEEVIALKHLLTVMNTSDGRSKFSQSRNACLIPSFFGVDGSEYALTVYLESQTTSSGGIPHALHQDNVVPTFREVGMCEPVQLLMRKNEATLISLALRYCSSTKTNVSTTPGSKKDSRKSHVCMTLEATYNCLHDFDVCPVLCG